MSTTQPFTQAEIDSAWALWQALMEHLETLWARYEKPFSLRLSRQQEWEEHEPSWLDDFTDDDIPF